MRNVTPRQPVLSGLRVLDIGHQYAAANCAGILADLGAQVVNIEHPDGNAIRTMLPKKDGHSLWWKMAARGKTQVSLTLSKPRGREIFLKMVKDFDVLIENFRPGTLEKWGLGPEDLEKAGANLTMVRISGYGQTGPYKDRPGFGTAGEAMSGFAHMNGFPDRPPVFPSTTLADGVASLWGVIAALSSRLGNLQQGTATGVEVVDVALFEGLFRIIPNQIAAYQQTGEIQTRPGNYLGDHGVLRNVYASSDGRYMAIAAVGDTTIRRILVGAKADVLVQEIDQGAMQHPETKVVQAFLERCDIHLTAWGKANTYDTMVADLNAAGAVFAPIFSAKDIMTDPHYQARGDLVTVDDPQLGPLTMQGIVPKYPAREHTVRHAGGVCGRDNASWYARYGLSAEDLEALRKDKII